MNNGIITGKIYRCAEYKVKIFIQIYLFCSHCYLLTFLVSFMYLTMNTYFKRCKFFCINISVRWRISVAQVSRSLQYNNLPDSWNQSTIVFLMSLVILGYEILMDNFSEYPCWLHNYRHLGICWACKTGMQSRKCIRFLT